MKMIGITATDTDVGKTIISGGLAAVLKNAGYRTGVFKPAASGCIRKNNTLISTDAEFLIKCSDISINNTSEVVPYMFEAALTPAEACKVAKENIDVDLILENAKSMLKKNEITVFFKHRLCIF